jgi:head-tail adaptor
MASWGIGEMRAGQLRHRIGLRKPAATTANAYGENIDDPDPAASQSVEGKFWADVTPLSGSELESARQVQSSVTHQVRMRVQPGMTLYPSWSIEHEARTLEILSVVPDRLNREWVILAREMTSNVPLGNQ